jgi:hypothetical protein
VVGLKLNGSLIYDPAPKINNADIFFGDATQMIIRDAYSDAHKSFYAIYNTSGHLLERHNIQSELQEVALPNAPGLYIIYVYFNGQVYRHSILVR